MISWFWLIPVIGVSLLIGASLGWRACWRRMHQQFRELRAERLVRELKGKGVSAESDGTGEIKAG